MSAEFRKQNPIYFTDRGGEFTNYDYSGQNGQNENYGAANIINGGAQSLASGYILDPTTGAVAGSCRAAMPRPSRPTSARMRTPGARSSRQCSNTNLSRSRRSSRRTRQASLDVGYFESKSQQYNHPESTLISGAYGGFQGVTSGPGVQPVVLPAVQSPTISSTNPTFPSGAGLLEPGLTQGILAEAFTNLGANGATIDDTDAKTYRAVADLDGRTVIGM